MISRACSKLLSAVLFLAFVSGTAGFAGPSNATRPRPRRGGRSDQTRRRIGTDRALIAGARRPLRPTPSWDLSVSPGDGDRSEGVDVAPEPLLAGGEGGRIDDGAEAAAVPPGEEGARGAAVRVQTTSFPGASYFLAFVAVRSLWQLFTLPTEIPGAFFSDSGRGVDYVATAFDVFFAGLGIQNLLRQAGLVGGEGDSNPVAPSNALADAECRVTLDVGRERGTMMEPEWAASGARLLLPLNLRFSRRAAEIDFPGEESLGGRSCRVLEVLDGDVITFVGPAGEVRVPVNGGCWAALPITEPGADRNGGAFKLRFFLDFPEGASKNDVTLPAGRVFFSGVAFADPTGVASGGAMARVGDAGAGVLREGRLTYKRNGPLNLWGAFGDTNAILGKYRVDSAKL